MKAWTLCLALGFLIWPVQTSAGQAGAQPKPAAPQKKEAAGVQVPPEYTIGFGDDLHLFIWKEGELTRDVNVRVDGRITVPLLGDLVAIGKTPTGLGREISTALGRFVENPLVTIIVSKATSARFFIIGEVKSAGAQPLTSNDMTMVQALAMAGGFGQFAKKDEILVIRGTKGLKVNYDRIQDGSDLAQNLVLQAGDTIIVP